jgi:calcineurin-like phosphoesterase family protein
MKRYISDWHYGHENILAFDNRPFSSVQEMNDVLVTLWNETVTPQDDVYVLGDMFWCKSSEAVPVLEKLNGRKFLVKGNHDRSNDGKFIRQFAKVSEYMEIEDEGRHVVLCHYPIPCFKNHLHGWFHLYGHVHDTFEYDLMKEVQRVLERNQGVPCQMCNVGAMMPYINYVPRTLDEILISNSAAEKGADAE